MFSDNKPLLQATGIGFSVREKRKIRNILSEINYTVTQGSFNLLLGSNGAGKTTFLRILTGLLKPSTGSLFYCGKPFSIQHRARIGYISENEKLPKNLTPGEILNYRARMFSLSGKSEKIEELCQEFGLSGFKNRKISTLSQGQKRRLSWASASISAPELLILDEPFLGLDPPGREELNSWLDSYHKKGNSVLLCTHDLNLIPENFHQLLVFSKGRVTYRGDGSPTLHKKELLSFYDSQDNMR